MQRSTSFASSSKRSAGRAVVEGLEGRRLFAASVTHIYELNGSYADQLGGPSITPAGGTLTSTGYNFAAGQGPSLSNAVDANTYSIEMLFKMTDVSGYRSIVNFKNLTTDGGFYNLSGKANLYPLATGANTVFTNNAMAHVVLTRDGGTKAFTAYVNGSKQFSLTDTNGNTTFSATNRIVQFLRDNGGEHPTGFLDRIRTYSGVLSQTEVTNLKNGATPPGLPSASPFALASDGTLTITGSSAADAISATLSGTTLTAKVGSTTKAYALASVKKIVVNANDGNDSVAIATNILLPTVLKGGNGNDNLIGGGGADLFDGGAGSDVYTGNGGIDTADYAMRTVPVNVFLDGYGNDGAVGERDNVRLDVENVLGGSKDDVIYGSSAANKLVGNGGNDYLFGAAGNDELLGNDGNDELVGGANNDTLNGGNGVDQLFGEDGDDTFFARDSIADLIDGGLGTDKAQRDSIDSVLSIESFIA